MFIIKILANFVADTLFAWFTPSWRREGHAVRSTAKRYLRHHSHKIKKEDYPQLAEPLRELTLALRDWDKERTIELTKLISHRSESFRGYRRPFIAEMVESLFVILVVFLGIRTYYAQPFRIPTGSMQPSLNGIIMHPVDEVPSFPTRAWDAVTKGSSYVDLIAETDKSILNLTNQTKYLLFVETLIEFSDGSTATVPSAPGAFMEYLRATGKWNPNPVTRSLASFRAGETIIRARIDAGDMVIVNRASYHFRRPELGESFVFDTRGINTDASTSQQMDDQSEGTHYIKRLSGLPGQTISITQPDLYVDGSIPDVATFQRISLRKPPYNPSGYIPADEKTNPFASITTKRSLVLRLDEQDPNMSEYAALGDNTENSLDSRYWGSVKQFNILGPAALCIWPFTEHWGLIP